MDWALILTAISVLGTCVWNVATTHGIAKKVEATLDKVEEKVEKHDERIRLVETRVAVIDAREEDAERCGFNRSKA